MYRNLRHAMEIIKDFLVYWKPMEKHGNGQPSSWAVTGDNDQWLFWGLHSYSLSLGSTGDACLNPVWACPDYVQLQWYKKEAGPDRRCGFTLLLCFWFLGGQRSAFISSFKIEKQLHSTHFHLREIDLESCVNFL